MAVERLKACDNIVELSQELGVHRRLLYKWRDQFDPFEPSEESPPGNSREATLREEINQLKRVPVDKTLELDFFKGALQKVEARRQKSGLSGERASEASEDYPDAANEIRAWAAIVKAARWHNFPEVRGTFEDADNVRGYVIFNVRQNRCRLITVIHYAKTTAQKRTQGHVYIRSFLTHKQYNNPANRDKKFGAK